VTGPAVQVAVNLTWCLPGRVGGSEEYLVRQLKGLSQIDHGFELTLFVPPGFARAHPDLAASHRLVPTPIDGHRRAVRIAMEYTWLARRTRPADLVHHGGGTVPGRGGRPVVLTVHDLQYRTYPRYFSLVKRAYLGATVPRSVRRAAVIAVPSSYVRGTVVAGFAIPPERVVVVPHGIEPDLGEQATPEADLRARFGLGEGPVLVYPAVTHPHKNHTFLLRLMATQWRDPDLRLVLIGGRGAAETQLWTDIQQMGLADRVLRPGRVDTTDRNGLLKMATALVFPSEYEGFGAPVAEAMHLGTPVICSDRASLPEVVGDAGLVLPLDLATWSTALDTVASRRAELQGAGQARATRYTTVRSAEALLGAYRLAMG
jgi:glycosyltransferase involved in cell wall biosynthesis